MSAPVMKPRLEILTSLQFVLMTRCNLIYPAIRMSNGKHYTYPLFVESPLYSKFVVLFEDELERAGQIVTAIRID